MEQLTQIGASLNAYKLNFDGSLLNEIRNVYLSTLSQGLIAPQYNFLLQGGVQHSISIKVSTYRFHLLSYGKSPLLWISAEDFYTYSVFKRFVDSLSIEDDIKKLVDFDKGLVMFAGFFVVGNQLNEENWHVDYFEGANAYTFITPLFEPDSSHGNLLYKDKYGNVQKYRYQINEAIIVGDRFLHSTECYGKTPNLRVLVSFTIGTDKSEYWPILKETIGTQSNFMYLPCGHQKGTCSCFPL
jgi:hypothetical protein